MSRLTWGRWREAAGFLLGTGLLSACVELIPPVTPRGESFNEAEYTQYFEPGTGTISGEACLWTRQGELMKVPERGVFLWPATRYVTEHLEKEILERDTLWFAPDSRIYKYRRETRSDKAGRFEFEKLPPGDYYLTCLFDWHETRVPPREETYQEMESRWVFTKVSLGPGVGVSGPLQPEVTQVPTREAQAPPLPQTITLVDRVLFESGKAVLTPPGREALDEVIARLAVMGPGVIRVEGHTDSMAIRGALKKQFADNYELSAARAAAVVQYLAEKGVDPSRISSEGFGETRPVASNETEAGRRKNRRIEIVLLPKETAGPGPAKPEPALPRDQAPAQPAEAPPIAPSEPTAGELPQSSPFQSAAPEAGDKPESGMPPSE